MKSLYSILRHQLVLGLLWSYKYIYTPIRVRKIRGKDKINVLFFLTSLGSWKTESLFRMMLTHPRFTPKILILKGVYFEDSRNLLRQYCDKYGYPYDEIDETKENLQQKFHPDIIIYQKPYAGEYAENLEFKYNLKSLFIYIPYGMRNTTESWQWDTPLLKHCWQIYYENKSIYDEYRMLSKANKRSGRLTGTPVMDDLLIPRNKLIDPWILTVPSKKRIIYAPHHSFDPDNQFDTGTFLLIGEQMLELAKSVSDRVQWAFKPHPVLRKKMETYWSKEKIDRYFNEWDKLGQVVEGGYMELFKFSDAMIHDCGSFILEYHATGNPVLYIDKPGSRMNATWNSTAREAMNLHYHASSIDQIRDFIENVIAGVDIRKDERQGFLNNHFTPPFNQSACQNIIDCILNPHMDKKMHP